MEQNTKKPQHNPKDNLRDLIEELFGLKLLPPENGLELAFQNEAFTLPFEECRDICLILANAYNRVSAVKIKANRFEILRIRLYHLLEQQVRLALTEKGASLNDIEAISKIYNMLKINNKKLFPDFKTLEAVVREYKPNATFEEIYALVEKHTN